MNGLMPPAADGSGYGKLIAERRVDLAFCALFVFASGWGQTFLLSIFQPYWRESIGLSASAMGALYGGATLLSGFLLPWTGYWLDRTTTERATVFTLAGLCLACLVAAVSHSVWMLGVALFLLRFFGQGFSANLGVTCAARWFLRNRAKALSLAALGFPLSEMILPLFVTGLVAGAGWRWTWVFLAIVVVFVLAPISRGLLRQRLDPVRPISSSPSSADPQSRDRGGLLRDWRFYAMLGVSAPIPFIGTGVIFF